MKNDEENNFVETLENLAFGSAVMAVDRKLKKCIEASTKTGKMSSLTLTLKFKPILGQDVVTFEVTDKCTASVPEAEHQATTFFGTEDNDLSVEHPSVIEKRKRLEASRKDNVKAIKTGVEK